MPKQQRAFGAAVGLALLVTAGSALAQVTPTPVLYPIRVSYDSTSDSTTRSVELQRGRYFLHFHKPRVIVALAYTGRTAPAAPGDVLIEFRTQSPQYTATNVLTLTAPGILPVLAVATGSHVHTHIQTTDHTLTFVLPAAELRPLVAAPKARLEVGGVKVELKRDRLEAIALLIAPSSSEP